MKNKLSLVVYLISFLLVGFVVFTIDSFHQEKLNDMTYNKYLTTSQNIKKTIQQAIDQKKQQGLTLAFSLANNDKYVEFFEDQSSSIINLTTLSNTLKKYTDQQNVWIHFVSKEGVSLYRSWTKKRGDNVAKVREELPPLLLDPKPVSLISVGIFDLAFKNIVPVYKNKSFLGIIEVITKVNSITNNLKSMGHETVVLVDKKYKDQLKKPFTKRFVQSYYVANLNAQENFLQQIKNDIAKYLDNDKFLLEQNKLVVTYHLKDVFEEDMAYFIIFDEIDKISTQDIDNFDAFVKTLGIFMFLLMITMLSSVYYYNRSRYTRKLESMVQKRTKKILELKDYHEALFDKNPNIVFVAVEDYGIIEVNDSFFEFFDKYRDLKEFNDKNNYLDSFIVKIDDETYIDPYKDWTEQVVKENRKICLKKEEKTYHFRLESEVLEHKSYDEVFLITLTDITELLNAQKDLEIKQELIYQQSKLASMGEMIGNIAHQWRQPLSIIASGATGMLLQKKMGVLDDKQFEKTCGTINDNAQYLSRTIDDFKNFIKNDRKFVEFNLKENMDSFLNLVVSSFKRHNIKIIVKVDESIVLHGYPNELIQCFMNIYNNTKDALKESSNSEKCLTIEAYQENQEIVIKFRDNAGGIPQEILPRIFEPYFTTKHQTQGTGLGLSMTYNLITQGMNGTIDVSNIHFEYQGEVYNGAEFKITLPLL